MPPPPHLDVTTRFKLIGVNTESSRENIAPRRKSELSCACTSLPCQKVLQAVMVSKSKHASASGSGKGNKPVAESKSEDVLQAVVSRVVITLHAKDVSD